MGKTLNKYDGCELVEDNGKLRFFYPDGDEEVVRKLVAVGDSPEENVAFYNIGNQTGTSLKQVFMDHVRSAV